jgi:hypothetical protein
MIYHLVVAKVIANYVRMFICEDDFHREGNPALEDSEGNKWYYWKGKNISEEEYNEIQNRNNIPT